MNQSLYNSTKSEYELFEQRCLSAKLDYSAIHQEIVAAEESKKSLEEKKKVNQNEQEFYNEVIQNQQENIVLLCDDIASLREDCEMIRVECNMNDEDSDVYTAQLENKVFLFSLEREVQILSYTSKLSDYTNDLSSTREKLADKQKEFDEFQNMIDKCTEENELIYERERLQQKVVNIYKKLSQRKQEELDDLKVYRMHIE